MAPRPSGQDDDPHPEPPHLRRLRRLVTVLTLTLIAGVITTTGLLVIRLASFDPAPALPVLPDTLALPPGETARAVTFGTGWIALVTVDTTGREHLRVYDTATGAARAALALAPLPAPDPVSIYEE